MQLQALFFRPNGAALGQPRAEPTAAQRRLAPPWVRTQIEHKSRRGGPNGVRSAAPSGLDVCIITTTQGGAPSDKSELRSALG